MTERDEGREVREHSEPELIRAAQSGDRGAYGELVRRYQQQVYRWAYQIVRSHDIADDVAQDVFLRTYQAIDRLDPERPLGAWLCRSTINRALNITRKSQYRARRVEEERPGVASSQPPANRPDELLHQREVLARVEQAIRELPAFYRAVLILRVNEQMSYEEIADTLGVSMGTVMSRLARARKRLRKVVGDFLDDLPRGGE